MARHAAKRAEAIGPVEGPWALPDGWRWERLDDVAPVNARHGLEVLTDEELVSFVPMAAVEAESGRIDVSALRPAKEVRQGFTRFVPGDVLFAKITPCMENGKIAVVPELKSRVGFGSTEFHVLRPQDVDPKYLYYFVSQRSFREAAEFNMTGTAGQKRVPPDFLRDALAPVPPRSVQKAILARINELFAEVDDGEAALRRVRGDLETWRKSLLKAAVTGELTADWRAANSPEETGADLLARMLEDRRTRWHADPKNKGKRYVEPARPDNAKLAHLPDGWVWATMEQLSWASGYGTSEKCATDAPGTPVLRIPNVRAGAIDLSNLKQTAAPLEFRPGAELSIGDLLIIRTNGSEDLIGRAALILDQLAEPTYFASYLIRLRLLGEGDLFRWLAILVDSPVFRAAVLGSIASSAGQYNLSLSKIESFVLPIPPLAEILIATSRYQQAAAEAVEGEIDAEAAHVAAATLRQSILAAAFRGKLVQ